jgi:hypothetical protein
VKKLEEFGIEKTKEITNKPLRRQSAGMHILILRTPATDG